MRLPLAALAGVLGALVLCPPAVALPSLGVNVAGIPSDEQLAEAEQLGARQVRMFLLWPDAEPRKGAINDNLAARYGAIVRRLAAAGIRPNLVVTMSPSWA
ncbi:MAG: hypothetical protein HZB46_11125 [Solirubrobacterales bacterium]|nr:hypothetical protein [Solirubrobacterales bacterium]